MKETGSAKTNISLKKKQKLDFNKTQRKHFKILLSSQLADILKIQNEERETRQKESLTSSN